MLLIAATAGNTGKCAPPERQHEILPCKAGSSRFTVVDAPGTLCCSKVVLTSCGVTLARCVGDIGAFYCQQAKCISGDACQDLPEWLQ